MEAAECLGKEDERKEVSVLNATEQAKQSKAESLRSNLSTYNTTHEKTCSDTTVGALQTRNVREQEKMAQWCSYQKPADRSEQMR